MKILALDTTTDHASIAYLCDGVLAGERHLHSQEGFSHLLFRELQELLEGHGTLSGIDLFAAASGPGSFTGVRVGLATAKGLAEAIGKSALGISNLQALASWGTEPLRATLIDARRKECYAAVYDANLRIVGEETVGDPTSWISALPEETYQFVTQHPDWLRTYLDGTRFAESPIVQAPLYMAAGIARCAELESARGASTDPLTIDANYVRRSDVNLYWHDR